MSETVQQEISRKEYSTAKGIVTQQEKSRGKKFTPKQRKFLTLLVKNDFKNPTAIMKEAGYSGTSWAAVYSLKEDIKELAEAILLGHTPAAAALFGETLDSDKPILNGNAKLQAAREILDRVGLTKEEKVKHQHEVQGGIFLMPSKAPLELDAEDVEVIDVN